jgi:hypothetical protein
MQVTNFMSGPSVFIPLFGTCNVELDNFKQSCEDVIIYYYSEFGSEDGGDTFLRNTGNGLQRHNTQDHAHRLKVLKSQNVASSLDHVMRILCRWLLRILMKSFTAWQRWKFVVFYGTRRRSAVSVGVRHLAPAIRHTNAAHILTLYALCSRSTLILSSALWLYTLTVISLQLPELSVFTSLPPHACYT